MCVNPRLLNNGASVACRKCWQCRENRVNDWVGRCIAEGRTSAAVSSVTLTYRPGEQGSDPAAAAVLTYSDVQKYIKRLRKNGYAVRYFAVGEFGSAKGRAHWHVILFWQRHTPPHPIGERFEEQHWPHGYSFWESGLNEKAIRYVCKYLQKDLGASERQGHLALSKRPPLGAAYFGDLARRYVSAGLSPQTAEYTFGGITGRDGNPLRFRLTGASLDHFIGDFLREWSDKVGGHPPTSDLVADYCDRVAGYERPFIVTPYKSPLSKPWIAPPGGAAMDFSEPANCWYADTPLGRLWWSFNIEGNRAWQDVIRTENQAENLRAVFEIRKASEGRSTKLSVMPSPMGDGTEQWSLPAIWADS